MIWCVGVGVGPSTTARKDHPSRLHEASFETVARIRCRCFRRKAAQDTTTPARDRQPPAGLRAERQESQRCNVVAYSQSRAWHYAGTGLNSPARLSQRGVTIRPYPFSRSCFLILMVSSGEVEGTRQHISRLRPAREGNPPTQPSAPPANGEYPPAEPGHQVSRSKRLSLADAIALRKCADESGCTGSLTRHQFAGPAEGRQLIAAGSLIETRVLSLSLPDVFASLFSLRPLAEPLF
jgi:hypothetical protein